jgi:anti-sigma factor RsiW
MKRCEEVAPLLGPLLDGALPDDDRAWVEDHLRGCQPCRDRQALIAAQAQAIRDVLAERAGKLDFTGFSDRVLARVRVERARAAELAPVWGRELWWAHRRAFAAAGVAALAVCAALALFFSPSRDEGALLAENSPQVEEVDFGTLNGAVLQLPRQTTVIWMSDEVQQ